MNTQNQHIKQLIADQQGTPTFEAILQGNDWAQYISQERSRRRSPEMFSRIDLQLAFIRSLSDEQLDDLSRGAARLDWIAQEIDREQAGRSQPD
jgi:hypothetical protein